MLHNLEDEKDCEEIFFILFCITERVDYVMQGAMLRNKLTATSNMPVVRSCGNVSRKLNSTMHCCHTNHPQSERIQNTCFQYSWARTPEVFCRGTENWNKITQTC